MCVCLCRCMSLCVCVCMHLMHVCARVPMCASGHQCSYLPLTLCPPGGLILSGSSHESTQVASTPSFPPDLGSLLLPHPPIMPQPCGTVGPHLPPSSPWPLPPWGPCPGKRAHLLEPGLPRCWREDGGGLHLEAPQEAGPVPPAGSTLPSSAVSNQRRV